MEKSFDFGRLLKNHEKKHKAKPAQFISVAGGVQKRLESNLKYRKSNRLTVFDSIRNLSRCESPEAVAATLTKEEHRRQQLEKWKEEKEKRKKEAAAQKKKPFIAGVPHAPLKFVPPPPPPTKTMPSTSGRVTRSQSAKLQNVKKVDTKQKVEKVKKVNSFAPKNASFQPPKNLTKAPLLAPITKSKKEKNNYVFNPVLPNHDKQTKSTKTKSQVTAKTTTIETRTTRNNTKYVTDSKKTKIPSKPSPKVKKVTKPLHSSSSSEIDTASSTEKSPIIKLKTPRKSSQKESKQFTPKNPVPKSESSSEERLRSPKSPVEVAMTPEDIAEEFRKISPRVTMSRGKDNARREMKKKLEEGLLDDDASNMDGVVHFRQQLDSEIKRMTEMCEVWEKILAQTPLSETIQECVLGAVGQARLLMSAKLQQFAALVELCARPRPGDALVTPADLQGFWDMVFMQVENIDMRFKKLEELRARNWIEEQPDLVTRKPVVKNIAKKAVKPNGGPSRLRDMIAAARKAKKEQENSSIISTASSIESTDSKTFEAGFFCVKSPVRSPILPATPVGKPSLLKSVLSSEAKKSASKSAASFAMLRASVLSRNIEDGIAPLPPSPITPINFHATPARSILKSANVSEKKSGKKSIKTVLFDEQNQPETSQLEQTTEQAMDSTGTNCHAEDMESLIAGVSKLSDFKGDSGMSSMDVEEYRENKENRRKGKLIRQDATTVDTIQVMTRSRRKSANTKEPEDLQEKTPRRSSRKKKALQELEAQNVLEERMETPKRSVRTRKSVGVVA